MSELDKNPLRLFYCYAREDKELRDALDGHLIGLKRQGLIEVWYDGKISAGAEWEKEIDEHLRSADIVLLLVSVAFMASDYCYGKEMEQALQRHEEGTTRVVPILLRPVDWEDAPFSKLQVLPTDARPVTTWVDLHLACTDIAKSLRVVVRELQVARKTAAEEWLRKGVALNGQKRYKEAVLAFDNAIHLNSNLVDAYNGKGIALYEMKRYEEALVAYEEALRLDSNNVYTYAGKGNTLNSLKRYEESLLACEQAIRLDSSFVRVYNYKGEALHGLRRYEEALLACEQALHLDPNNAEAYSNKGAALSALKRYEEALLACEQAIRLDSSFVYAYNNEGAALYGLERYKEALEAFERAIRLDPNSALIYNNKGLVLDNLGRFTEAQQAQKKAKELGWS